MKIKYSVITGFLGKLRDRFKEYQTERDLKGKLELAANIEGLGGVEVIYPSDFADLELLKNLLQENGLGVSAVNVNIKSGHKWDKGALTASSKETRIKAIRYLKNGMEMARGLGASRITCCPLQDGHDYSFQHHYGKTWQWIIEGFKEVARHDRGIGVCIEYKFNEPMGRQTIGTVGKAMYIAKQTGQDNVGVTVDVGHALLAGENPAESIAILAEEGIPYYVHVNDNFRNWDWDMMAGTVNVWDYIELLIYLREYGYEDWIAMDVTPKYLDPVEVYSSTIAFMKRFEKIVETIDPKVLEDLTRMDLPKKFRQIFDKTIVS